MVGAGPRPSDRPAIAADVGYSGISAPGNVLILAPIHSTRHVAQRMLDVAGVRSDLVGITDQSQVQPILARTS